VTTSGRVARQISLLAAVLLAAGAAAGVGPARAATVGGPGAVRAAVPRVRGVLSGAAAVSARDVWAVGTADPLGTLILHWDGTAWKRVPGPAAARGRLFAVAAVSARDVWAVGTDLGRALIVHWNGAGWHRVAAPSPAAGTILQGVAAVSARDVWAVGTTGILRWDGAAWRRVRAPGGTGAGLTAVAATSGRNAWAVGTGGILRWDGTAWTRVRHPGFAHGSLYGVTATSAANAWAAGTSFSQHCPTVGCTLTVRWNGTAWTRVRSPNPPARPQGNWLFAAAAAPAGQAWAVGGTSVTEPDSGTLILRWSGTTWTRVRSPSPPGGVNLFGVAALAGNTAWAVGGTTSATPARPVILRWNGTTWTRVL